MKKTILGLATAALILTGAPSAEAASRVATKAEYRQLRAGMTQQQVLAVFDAPTRVTERYAKAVYISGSTVIVGARVNREFYTGRNRYENSGCWATQTEFYQDPDGRYRLRDWENWSNICSTRYNR
jgi:hypothetical protein